MKTIQRLSPGIDYIGFRHTMLFNFKDAVSSAERKRRLAVLEDLGKLPMVQGLLIGMNAVSIAPDRDRSRVFESGIIGDFAGSAEFEAFQADPTRQVIQRELGSVLRNLITANVDRPFYVKGLDPERRRAPVKYRHTVFINFKDDVPDVMLRHILATMKGAIATQPTVQGFMLGKNIEPLGEASPYAWICIVDFASEADHTAYQQYPLHRHIDADIFTPNCAGFAQFDTHL